MISSAWAIVIDFGIISVLLLIGKLIRAKVGFIQRWFLPPSLIAGFIALLCGPEVFGVLPLDPGKCGTYSAILIALVFSCIPLTSPKKKLRSSSSVGRMWAYSNAGMLLQWAFGGALGLWVFSIFWPGTEAIGIAMPAGFCGGHGTAAAMGDAFAAAGVGDIQSLAMTCATAGIIAAVVFGLAMIKWGTNHQKTVFLKKYSDLPDELRTGIMPKDKRDSIGEASFSAISLDSLTYNLGVIFAVSTGGYGVSKLIAHFWPLISVPVFISAFLVGLVIRLVFDKTGASEHICTKTVGHLSGAFTDYLVAFGVASIRLTVLWKLIIPLTIMIVAGLVLTFVFVIVVGKCISKDYWYERSVFTWGWFTGTLSMSIALLRIVDPDMKTGILDDYAYAYIYVAPVEMALICLAPLAFVSGFGWLYIGICLAVATATLVAAAMKGWLKYKEAD